MISKQSRRFGALAVPCIALIVGAMPVQAAEPASGTVSPGQPSTSWRGGPFEVSNPVACQPGVDAPGCDRFHLTIEPPAEGGHLVEVSIEPSGAADDYDLFVFAPDGSEAGSSATASGSETVTLEEPEAGTYEVVVQAWLVDSASTYHGSAVLGELPEGNGGPQPSEEWIIRKHGACCEGNLAAFGDMTYVLAPILIQANDIFRSGDGGQGWEKVYPPIDISVPFGIEGDLQAFGNDVIYFGTELTHGVVARSVDRGSNWTVFQVPVAFAANDQAWSYLGPVNDVCPVQAAPYVLSGWYRIGSVMLFSCDGGRTWPIQTPLVGLNGSGPEHALCKAQAREPASAGDTRVANPDFVRKKAGRHGGWGADGKFYWSETDGEHLYICNTGDFGATWDGVRHPLAEGTPGGVPVTWFAFDDNGTLYVLHADKLYASFDRGESVRFVHTLPRWGNDNTGDGGSAQFFVVDNGVIHVGLRADGPGARGDMWYLRGEGVDTAEPAWSEELVDLVEPEPDGSPVRLDFMQIIVDGNGIPTLGYTTADGGTTTASRLVPPRMGDAFPGAVDVTDRIELLADNARFEGGVAAFDLRLRNKSLGSVFAPLAAEITALESPSGRVTAANADNGAPAEGAFWRYDERLNGDDELAAGETSQAVRLEFNDPDGEPFTVSFRVLSGTEPEAGGPSGGDASALIRLTVDPLLGTVTTKIVSEPL